MINNAKIPFTLKLILQQVQNSMSIVKELFNYSSRKSATFCKKNPQFFQHVPKLLMILASINCLYLDHYIPQYLLRLTIKFIVISLSYLYLCLYFFVSFYLCLYFSVLFYLCILVSVSFYLCLCLILSLYLCLCLILS